jgi:hypothetical protein
VWEFEEERPDRGGTVVTTVMEEIDAVEPPRTDAQGLVEERERERGERERGRGVGFGDEAGGRNQQQQQLPDGDPDDEEDVCRICRTPGDADSSLYHPCACSGSIKYVHQECLLQWLNHSNARQCEVRLLYLRMCGL